MPLVHDAVQAATVVTHSRGGLIAAAAAMALSCALAACGGSGAHVHSATPYPYAGPGLHGSLTLADCDDWNKGPEALREATIQQLRAFFGSQIGSGKAGAPHAAGAVLPDAKAHAILQRLCAQPFARGFKLYKLYGRAASFAGTR